MIIYIYTGLRNSFSDRPPQPPSNCCGYISEVCTTCTATTELIMLLHVGCVLVLELQKVSDGLKFLDEKLNLILKIECFQPTATRSVF